MLKANDLPTVNAMQGAWLNGSDEECEAIVNAISAYVNCNPHKLYSALTNLHCLVLSDADISGDI